MGPRRIPTILGTVLLMAGLLLTLLRSFHPSNLNISLAIYEFSGKASRFTIL